MPKFERKDTKSRPAKDFSLKPRLATNADVFANRGDAWTESRPIHYSEEQIAYDAQVKAKRAPAKEDTVSGRIERQDTKPNPRSMNDPIRKRMQIALKMKAGMKRD